jgi:hypothetical protein
VEDRKRRKVLPHLSDELSTTETRHVVIGDDDIEWDFGCPGCVQCGEAVGYCHDLKTIVSESPGYERPNHRFVVDYEDAVGHRAFAQEYSELSWGVPAPSYRQMHPGARPEMRMISYKAKKYGIDPARMRG